MRALEDGRHECRRQIHRGRVVVERKSQEILIALGEITAFREGVRGWGESCEMCGPKGKARRKSSTILWKLFFFAVGFVYLESLEKVWGKQYHFAGMESWQRNVNKLTIVIAGSVSTYLVNVVRMKSRLSALVIFHGLLTWVMDIYCSVA